MWALTTFEYKLWVENMLSKINKKKKQDLKKLELKDHNRNRQQMIFLKLAEDEYAWFNFKKFLVRFYSRKQEDPL